MKKILLSSLALFLFSASIFMFQLSCSKDANAGGSGGSSSFSQGKILINKDDKSFVIIDKNGTQTIVNITLPNGFIYISDNGYTTDGNNIWFRAGKPTGSSGATGPTTSWDLMICDMNGNNVKIVTNISGFDGDETHAF